MLRKILAALVTIGAIILLPAPAFAEEYVPTPPPRAALLSGSSVTGVCDDGVPVISYNVILTDPDHQSTGNTASLIFSSGGNSHTIVLGELKDGKLSGEVLWPGAKVAADGSPDGWPGWVKVNGEWVETTGNFAWTRSTTQATISVNPSIPVALSYPDATPDCETDPPDTTTASTGGTSGVSASGLSSTGVDVAVTAAAAGGLLLLGLIVALVARRRASTR